MAYTFDELAQWWPGKSFPVGSITLLITQEDGRTCYAYGFINVFYPTANRFEGQFQQQFNDRTRQLNYGAPSPGAGVYVQNFDQNAGVDLANFAFVKTATNLFELRLTLLNWGNAVVTSSMTEAAQAKLYTGWGSTIGAGTSQALFVVSLNGANETPG